MSPAYPALFLCRLTSWMVFSQLQSARNGAPGILLWGLFVVLGIEAPGTFRTDPVGEVSLRAVADVTLDRDPFTAFIANFFARGADGRNAGEGFDLGQGIGQFRDQVLAFGLRPVSSRSMLSTPFVHRVQ
jgi:hypothetical protein